MLHYACLRWQWRHNSTDRVFKTLGLQKLLVALLLFCGAVLADVGVAGRRKSKPAIDERDLHIHLANLHTASRIGWPRKAFSQMVHAGAAAASFRLLPLRFANANEEQPEDVIGASDSSILRADPLWSHLRTEGTHPSLDDNTRHHSQQELRRSQGGVPLSQPWPVRPFASQQHQRSSSTGLELCSRRLAQEILTSLDLAKQDAQIIEEDMALAIQDYVNATDCFRSNGSRISLATAVVTMWQLPLVLATAQEFSLSLPQYQVDVYPLQGFQTVDDIVAAVESLDSYAGYMEDGQAEAYSVEGGAGVDRHPQQPALLMPRSYMMLYYRSDVLAALGISPPSTWQQLIHAADAVRNASLASGRRDKHRPGNTSSHAASSQVACSPDEHTIEACRSDPARSLQPAVTPRGEAYQQAASSLPSQQAQTADVLPELPGEFAGMFGVCLDLSAQCKRGYYLTAIAASMLQVGGPQQGHYFEPETLRSLYTAAVVPDALHVLSALAATGPDQGLEEAPCHILNQRFAAGDCAFTLDWDIAFSAMNLSSSAALRGNLGVAMLPGSTVVLDRTLNQLVEYTPEAAPLSEAQACDPKRSAGVCDTAASSLSTGMCAIEAAALMAGAVSCAEANVMGRRQPGTGSAAGAGVLVNHAPLSAFSLYDGFASAVQPLSVQAGLLRLALQIRGKLQYWLDARGATLAQRPSPSWHLGTGSALPHQPMLLPAQAPVNWPETAGVPPPTFDIAQWAAMGYHADDAQAFFRAMWVVHSHPNTAPDLGIPLSGFYRLALDDAAGAALASNTTDFDQICRSLAHQFQCAHKAYNVLRDVGSTSGSSAGGSSPSGGLSGSRSWPSLEHAYWQSIGAGPGMCALGQDTCPPPGEPSAADVSDTAIPAQLMRPMVMGVVAAAVAVNVLALVLLLRHFVGQRLRHRSLFGKLDVPGLGRDTTLLLTDIENSTMLWESLPVDCMDLVVKQHHNCIRQAAERHDGYESATEGDCFILAFHHTADALRFAMDAQLALLHTPWPQPLLEHPLGRPVWVTACPEPLMSEDSALPPAEPAASGMHAAAGLVGGGTAASAAVNGMVANVSDAVGGSVGSLLQAMANMGNVVRIPRLSQGHGSADASRSSGSSHANAAPTVAVPESMLAPLQRHIRRRHSIEVERPRAGDRARYARSAGTDAHHTPSSDGSPPHHGKAARLTQRLFSPLAAVLVSQRRKAVEARWSREEAAAQVEEEEEHRIESMARHESPSMLVQLYYGNTESSIGSRRRRFSMSSPNGRAATSISSHATGNTDNNAGTQSAACSSYATDVSLGSHSRTTPGASMPDRRIQLGRLRRCSTGSVQVGDVRGSQAKRSGSMPCPALRASATQSRFGKVSLDSCCAAAVAAAADGRLAARRLRAAQNLQQNGAAGEAGAYLRLGPLQHAKGVDMFVEVRGPSLDIPEVILEGRTSEEVGLLRSSASASAADGRSLASTQRLSRSLSAAATKVSSPELGPSGSCSMPGDGALAGLSPDHSLPGTRGRSGAGGDTRLHLSEKAQELVARERLHTVQSSSAGSLRLDESAESGGLLNGAGASPAGLRAGSLPSSAAGAVPGALKASAASYQQPFSHAPDLPYSALTSTLDTAAVHRSAHEGASASSAAAAADHLMPALPQAKRRASADSAWLGASGSPGLRDAASPARSASLQRRSLAEAGQAHLLAQGQADMQRGVLQSEQREVVAAHKLMDAQADLQGQSEGEPTELGESLASFNNCHGTSVDESDQTCLWDRGPESSTGSNSRRANLTQASLAEQQRFLASDLMADIRAAAIARRGEASGSGTVQPQPGPAPEAPPSTGQGQQNLGAQQAQQTAQQAAQLVPALDVAGAGGPPGDGGGQETLDGKQHSVQTEAYRCMSWAQSLRAMWQIVVDTSAADSGDLSGEVPSPAAAAAAAPAAPDRVLIFRGLRVRMGMHSGVTRRSDLLPNRAAGRRQYSGHPMRLARQVQDAAHGGQVLLSREAFQHLPLRKVQRDALLIYAGDHQLASDSGPEALTLYQANPPCLLPRLGYLGHPRSLTVLQRSTTMAPVGHITACFMYVVGTATLLADIPEAARHGLDLFQAVVARELIEVGGYLLETTDGMALAAFHHPCDALLWGLRCQAALLVQEWDAELLAHALGEEIFTYVAAPIPPAAPLPARYRRLPGADDLEPLLSTAPADLLHQTRCSDPGDEQALLLQRSQHLGNLSAPGCTVGSGVSLLDSPSAGAEDVGEDASLMSSSPISFNTDPAVSPPAIPPAAAANIAQSGTGMTGGRNNSHVLSAPSFATSGQRQQQQQQQQKRVLCRGLRLKAGCDVGLASPEVSATTGRMVYRGRVMNRAARIATRAAAGRVLASSTAWLCAQASPLVEEYGVSANSMGEAVPLKGIPEPLQLFDCTLDEEALGPLAPLAMGHSAAAMTAHSDSAEAMRSWGGVTVS